MSKKVLVITTSLRHGSNSNALAGQFAKGAEEAGPNTIQDNPALAQAYEMGRQA